MSRSKKWRWLCCKMVLLNGALTLSKMFDMFRQHTRYVKTTTDQ